MSQTALVTGASSGIGEDLARLLAADGHDVVLLARSADKLQALANSLHREHGVTATALAEDLSRPDAADRVFGGLSSRRIQIDVLINNAGFGTFGEFARSDPAEQARMLTLTMLSRSVLPGMIERGRGRILNVASTAAFQPGPLMATYYASKAYVLLFSEALAEETRGTGVTVTCLCPGPTRTAFQSRAGMEKSRLLRVSRVMSSHQVARAGYEGMLAGRSLVIPGLANKLGVLALRLAPRRVVPRIVRALQREP
jgi:short-subunit dehydrogenase